MDKKIEKKNDVVKEGILNLPFSELENEYNEIVKEYRNAASIPGFRKGKAPVSIIEGRFKYEIERELLKYIVEKYYNEVKEEAGKTVYEHLSSYDFSKKDGATLKFYFEVMPEIENIDLENLEVKIKKEKEVNIDEEVEKVIEDLRNKYAKVKPVEDRDTVEKGDIVTMKIYGEDEEGKTLFDNENFELEINPDNDDMWKLVSEKLIGAKKGEETKFEIEFPDEEKFSGFKGKKVKFTVTVNNINVKEMPEVDEEFAKTLNFDSVDALKKDIRESIEKRLKEVRREEKIHNFFEKLFSEVDIPVPPVYAREEAKRMIQDYLRNLGYNKADENIINTLMPQYYMAAVDNVKRMIVLSKLAEMFNVEVTEDELDEFLKPFVPQFGENATLESVKFRLDEEGQLEDIKESLKREKALDLLIEKAKFVEVSEEEYEDEHKARVEKMKKMLEEKTEEMKKEREEKEKAEENKEEKTEESSDKGEEEAN
ncbi:trigger factor [Thermotomaculum hydrothermale]|uniref:Trigger factor n=1 Tax=Thermotomaculum hydrothermale TaxID=981385 RepID=A0A7R6PE04_9BACT|nr:trigger factor [Thermotomaculum hydrothermale]BBB31938.1 trigger factor [Thermotomaculum hydrothermale]